MQVGGQVELASLTQHGGSGVRLNCGGDIGKGEQEFRNEASRNDHCIGLLARAVGVNVDPVALLVSWIDSAMAEPTGRLAGYDSAVAPFMGFGTPLWESLRQ